MLWTAALITGYENDENWQEKVKIILLSNTFKINNERFQRMSKNIKH